jgi:hypothetical protein
MNSNHRLREQIDVCRGAGDLSLPEMAELSHAVAHTKAVADELAKAQGFDRIVLRELNDLPVPDRLKAKIIAAIEAAEASEKRVAHAPAIPASRKQIWSARWTVRRTRYIAAMAAALLLMVTAGGYYWHRSQQLIEQEQIASALKGLQKAAHSNRTAPGWPSDFVIPQLPIKPVRYVPFKTAEGWTAVAVDCTTPAGSPATLFIVRSRGSFFFGPSPVTRLAAPGQKVEAWRKGRLLYVLVEEVARPRAGARIVRSSAPPA